MARTSILRFTELSLQLARGRETTVDVADARRVEHDGDREVERLSERRSASERRVRVREKTHERDQW